MELTVDLQISEKLEPSTVPNKQDMSQWIKASIETAALTRTMKEIEVSIRVVDQDESQLSNLNYRQQNKPTNVLSFPAELPDYLDLPLLGDLLICAPILEQEAKSQNKKEIDHWAHIIVHGTLHLLGYDHIEDSQALEMETLEIEILKQFHINNPYQLH